MLSLMAFSRLGVSYTVIGIETSIPIPEYLCKNKTRVTGRVCNVTEICLMSLRYVCDVIAICF